MQNLKHLAEGLTLGAASIGASVVTGTQNVVNTVENGELLPTLMNIPAPDQINTTMNLITQITILVVTLWRTLKKDKKQK